MSPVWDLPSPADPVLAGAGAGAGGTVTAAAAAAGRAGLFDLRFDPVTGDFIRDGAGAWELTTTAETAVVHQMLCWYQRWWGDPEAGSRLHDLGAFAADPEGAIDDETRRALSALVEAGLIADLEVDVVESKLMPGRVDAATNFRDTRTGLAVNLAVPAAGV